MRILVVGGNLGSVGLIEYLANDVHAVVDVATIAKDHPAQEVPGINDFILYPSNALDTKVNLDVYDFIIPGSHDLYLRDIAEASQCEVTRFLLNNITNKSTLQKSLKKIGAHEIATVSCCDESCLDRFLENCRSSQSAALVKPVADSGGGKGIYKIKPDGLDNTGLRDIRAKLAEGWILEKVEPGRDFAISLFIRGGRLIQWYSDCEFVENYRVVGSITNENVVFEMEAPAIYLTKCLSKLGFSSGFYHCQIRYVDQTRWKVIEITPRLPGDAYWWPAEKIGLPYRQWYAEAWMKMHDFLLPYKAQCSKSYGRVYAQHVGILEKKIGSVQTTAVLNSSSSNHGYKVHLFEAPFCALI